VDAVPLPLHRVREFLHEEYERAFRHESWHIGLVDAPIASFLEPGAHPEVRWLPLPARGTYFADPFGLSKAGTIEILFERFDFRSNKGSIAWMRCEDGRASRPEVVLDFPFHASYPFLLEHDGDVYCIPETAEAREVAMYRAVQFPRRWEKTATLLKGVAASDSTIIHRDGRFWLFCTDSDDGPYSKLRIWFADDLAGPWTGHPSNPVKTDVGSARPAGTPFEADGELFRPAQDSSRTYGGSVSVNRVVRLTATAYEEEPAAVVGPFLNGPYVHGIHTLSAVGDRTLVDGKRFLFNRAAMTRNLRESVESRWGRALLRR